MSSEIIQVQKLANKSATQIQKLVNKANKATLNFNAQEAKKTREFNRQEASTAREFNAAEAVKEREFNSAEAQKSRDWQEYMSNTSHQREVADLKAAGINPVLSAGGGAQSYTTSSASAGAASASPASGSNAYGSAESGASAIASILGTMMNSMVGLRQTELSNQAHLRAAQIQASASKYASDNALAAAKYSADRNYESAMDRPAGSIVQTVDKHLQKAGVSDAVHASIRRGIDEIAKDPNKFFYNLKNSNSKNLNPTNQGFNKGSNILKNIGIRNPSKADIKDFFSFIFFGSTSGRIVSKIRQIREL